MGDPYAAVAIAHELTDADPMLIPVEESIVKAVACALPLVSVTTTAQYVSVATDPLALTVHVNEFGFAVAVKELQAALHTDTVMFPTKPVPVIVMLAPVFPDEGEMPVIVHRFGTVEEFGAFPHQSSSIEGHVIVPTSELVGMLMLIGLAKVPNGQ